ncbi:hypothetical protein [Amycolatopsis nigrescens]|uniref:hypothetical protein n=1 Tax=Amycolatopsis nigrescens TaxID=381445 RepID=UPI00039DB8C9|nr:hypothetical protein [Amycolatopsis nigrescens]
MNERERVLGLLGEAGVLAGIRWSQRSAYAQVRQDFNPDGGHDQGWIGYTAHKYLINRQDRVFQCERYGVPAGEGDVGRDVLAAGILDRDFKSMPMLESGTVVRQDLNHSPGWLFGEWRWLMASFEFGQSDKIRWPWKSETKGMVARQPYADDEEGLFRLPGLPPLEDLADRERVLRNTLVLAHAMDPDSGETELYLGRSRWNFDKGDAWAWKVELLSRPPDSGRRGARPQPVDPTTPHDDDIADAEVRVRRSLRGTSESRAIGEV